MNYGALDQLNTVLKNLTSDLTTIAFSVGGLMLVIGAIMIMIDIRNNVAAHTSRMEGIHRVFLGVAVAAAGGGLIIFGKALGGAVH